MAQTKSKSKAPWVFLVVCVCVIALAVGFVMVDHSNTTPSTVDPTPEPTPTPTPEVTPDPTPEQEEETTPTEEEDKIPTVAPADIDISETITDGAYVSYVGSAKTMTIRVEFHAEQNGYFAMLGDGMLLSFSVDGYSFGLFHTYEKGDNAFTVTVIMTDGMTVTMVDSGDLPVGVKRAVIDPSIITSYTPQTVMI